jgi:hypothetical protein
MRALLKISSHALPWLTHRLRFALIRLGLALVSLSGLL